MGKQLVWIEDTKRRTETLAAATRLVQIARGDPDLPTDLRRFLVNKAIWYWTEDRTPSRKFKLRYRTRSALDLQQDLGLKEAARQLEHEHVHERKNVIDALLNDAPRIDPATAIRACAACVVTKPEHVRLRNVRPGTRGWLRYREAELEVVDLLTGSNADLTALVAQDELQWSDANAHEAHETA
ncbi:hypothetical protein [Promicromonospora sp. NPDC057488]|uniref:hypothetical protein n=1 Tax=Promicromonospora sp. NPDC057488 TaxID=3346147 RepID=UPI0036733755